MAMATAPEMWIRAVGTALAGVSVVFAGYMLAFGEGKVRVNGMDHLAIFAQPRSGSEIKRQGAADALPGAVVEGGSGTAPAPRPARIVAAQPGRVWLMIGGAIRSAGPSDNVPGVGRIGAIVQRDGGWALLGDGGATLLSLAKEENGARLFSRGHIFE